MMRVESRGEGSDGAPRYRRLPPSITPSLSFACKSDGGEQNKASFL